MFCCVSIDELRYDTRSSWRCTWSWILLKLYLEPWRAKIGRMALHGAQHLKDNNLTIIEGLKLMAKNWSVTGGGDCIITTNVGYIDYKLDTGCALYVVNNNSCTLPEIVLVPALLPDSAGKWALHSLNLGHRQVTVRNRQCVITIQSYIVQNPVRTRVIVNGILQDF